MSPENDKLEKMGCFYSTQAFRVYPISSLDGFIGKFNVLFPGLFGGFGYNTCKGSYPCVVAIMSVLRSLRALFGCFFRAMKRQAATRGR